MINDLSIALRSLLSPAMGGADIVFDQPSEAFKPTRTTLNLFLYDIRENLELRTSEPRVEPRAAEKVAMRRPLFRIACSYLITAWVMSGDEPPLQEQRLLSQALLLLKQYSTIPAAFLPASLRDQQPPLPMMVAQADGLKEPQRVLDRDRQQAAAIGHGDHHHRAGSAGAEPQGSHTRACARHRCGGAHLSCGAGAQGSDTESRLSYRRACHGC